MAKIAIATNDIGKYSETFVRQHVRNLFGGDTVVIALSGEAPSDLTQPIMHCDPILSSELSAEEFALAHQKREEKLKEFLSHHQVTTVLCEFGFTANWLSEPLFKNGYKVYCYFRGSDSSKRLNNAKYVKKLKWVLPQLSGVLSVSQFLLDNLAKVGLSHPNSIVVPSGADTKAISAERGDGEGILTIARLIEKKAPIDGLKAFKRIASETDVHWRIIGGGEMEPEIRRGIEEMGLTDRVHLMGPLPYSECLYWMERCAVLFQPYRTASTGDTEGLPTVLQEAMAAGRRIVTTKHAGIPELIRHGHNGLLYPEGDIGGLAIGLRLALSSKDALADMRRRARAYAEQHLDYRILNKRTEAFLSQDP